MYVCSKRVTWGYGMYDLVLVQQKLLFHNEFDAMQSFQFLFHFVQSRFQIFHKTS